MLKLERVDSFYGASQALFGMSLSVETGQVVTLIGRNGMGKTTSVHASIGIQPIKTGAVWFRGQRVDGLPSYEIARRGMGLVPEGRQIFPNLTVTENLIATAENRSGKSRPWTLDRVFQLFPSLVARKDSMGNLLSGGEQQMLAIGRALMTNPRLLLLDEATEGLAPLVRQEIWSALERLKYEGQSILVIDKNIQDLARIADHHYIVEKGSCVWNGTSEALLATPEIAQKYLGV